MPSKISSPKPAKPYVFEAIGTQWQITLSEGQLAATAVTAVQACIAGFDASYSRFKADSWLTKAGAKPGVYQLPADAKPLFDMYEQLYRVTKGAMTPLIGQTLSQAGYDPVYSLKSGTLTALPSWDETLMYNYPQLTVKQLVQLDVGAAGKGYLVDIVSELLVQRGLTDFVVDAGGDMRIVSDTNRVTQVGLENPFDNTEVIGIAELCNQSLCASAGNRRRWGEFNHIIDPYSLRSPTDIAAVWVVAATTLLADALTTALYFAEPATLLQHYTFSYVIMNSDRSVTVSDDFPAQLFTS